MKVIFLQTVENNKLGEVKDVSNGYARNYLIPKGLAVAATKAELKNIEARLKKAKKEEEQRKKELEKTASDLDKLKLEFFVKVHETAEGRKELFGSITEKDIAKKLAEKGYNIEKQEVVLHEHIKELGEHEAEIRLGSGVSVKIKLDVKEVPRQGQARDKKEKE